MPAIPTHCPYCALQCGMLVTADERDGRRASAPNAKFPVNKGGLCLKGWTAAETLTHRDARAPLVRGNGVLVEPSWDAALDAVAARIRDTGQRARPRRGRRVRRRLAHQREGLPARQVRARRARHGQHRLQRPLLHVVGGGGRAPAPSASTAACRSRSKTSPRPRSILLVGANPAETMPPIMQYFERAAAKRRHADRRRSAPHGDRGSGPRRHLRSARDRTPRSPTACCTCSFATV